MEKILDAMFEAVEVIINVAVTIVNAAITAVNAIIKFINRVVKALKTIGIKLNFNAKTLNKLEKSTLGSLIDSRINMMVMEEDYVNTPKIMLIERNSNPRNNKLLPTNEAYLNAKYLYENYHYFNNFVTTNGVNNQGKIRNIEDVHFEFDDYEKIRASGNILDADGKEGTLRTHNYSPIEEQANYDYKVREIYTNNLQIKTQYPNE
jgi:hypothetical protein